MTFSRKEEKQPLPEQPPVGQSSGAAATAGGERSEAAAQPAAVLDGWPDGTAITHFMGRVERAAGGTP